MNYSFLIKNTIMHHLNYKSNKDKLQPLVPVKCVWFNDRYTLSF